jgi:plastocyanin
MGGLDIHMTDKSPRRDDSERGASELVTRRGLVSGSLVLAAAAIYPAMALARQGASPAGSPVSSPAASPVASPGVGGGVVIDVVNFAFEPPTLTVPVGTTVTWVNVSETIHNVVDTNERFASPVLDPGDSFEAQVTEPGVYVYVCTIHPNMEAELTVE